MNNGQETALRCALADLVGAYQAWEQGDCNVHDWEAHAASITELAEAFGMQDEIPEEPMNAADEADYYAEIEADIRADKRENGTGY
jgi:hypothetical protein